MKLLQALIIFALSPLSPAFSGEKTYLIEEPFGSDHGPQAVTFEEVFETPGVALASLGATVDGQPAFFQRRALETHPDGTVKKAEWVLWLHLATPRRGAEAPAGSKPRFDVKLTWDGQPANSAPFPGKPITLSKDSDYLVVDTGAAQFRVPDNKVTMAPGGPQGPIAGFRTAGDPNWWGGNAFIEGAKISSVKTNVNSEGPARAVIDVVFADADDNTWTSQLTFTSGSPVVQIEDSMELQGTWVIDLTNDMAPDTQFANPWFDWESGNQRGSPSEKPLRAWKRSEIRGGEWNDLNEFFRLDPKWHDYQYMKGPYAWYYNKAQREQKPTAFAMFAWNMSRWHPTNANRPRVYVEGEKKGALRIRVPLTGGPHTRTLEAEDPADPVPRSIRTTTSHRSWGIAAFPTPDIRKPEDFQEEARAAAQADLPKIARSEVQKAKREMRKRAETELKNSAAGQSGSTGNQTVESKMVELGWPAKSDKELESELLGKMVEELPAEEVGKRAQKLAAESISPVRNKSVQTLVRNAHLPVSKFKDWVLTWPDMDRNVDRGIFKGLDELAKLQSEIQAGESETGRAVKAYIEEMRQSLVVDPKAKGGEAVDKKYRKDWQTAKAIMEGNVSEGPVFIFNTPGNFKPNSGWIYGSGYTDGGLNPTTAPRGVRGEIWDQSINHQWKQEGRAAQNREMAAMAYIFSDPDFWNGRYYDWGIGNPNFHTDMHNIPGMIAAQINTHPDAKKWADYSKREITGDIARSSWQPGGGWTESPGYTAHAFSVFLPTAHAFRRSGLVNPFEDPLFKGALGFTENLLTPLDRRRGVRSIVSLGDSSNEARTSNYLQAAMGYKETDPEFAANMMSAARSTIKDGDLIKPGTLGDTLVSADLTISPNPKWTLKSRYYGGIGAFLRSRFGTPEEALVTFKAGPARNHYQGDELAFTFWGNGDYLAVDYSSFYNPRMNPDWTHNKVSFGLAASTPVARVMAFETSPEADLVVAENVNSSIQIMTPPYASNRAVWDYQSLPIPEQTNRRLLLLVKHPEGSPFADYLVIRDEIQGDRTGKISSDAVRTRLQIVIEELMDAYVTDAGYSQSSAAELFVELRSYLMLLGADSSTADSLVDAAKRAVVPGRTEPFKSSKSPEMTSAIAAALPKFEFDSSPRANFHLLALENPAKSRDRLDFKGQMGSDIAFFVATGQDASAANIQWFGWGHNRRPADFVKGPLGPKGEQRLPWMGGAWHSYRHGFVLGRDVRLATDKSSDLPPYTFGEMCQWVSLPFGNSSELTVVLYPVGKGKPAPAFESLDGGKSVRVTVAGRSETVSLASGLPVKIVRDNKESVLSANLPPIGGPQPEELVPRRSVVGVPEKPDDNPNFDPEHSSQTDSDEAATESE